MSDSALSIGLFYGSTTCYTEMAAEKIQAQLNSLFDEDIVDLHNIKDVNLTRTAEYDIIIFGISTWDFGELQEDLGVSLGRSARFGFIRENHRLIRTWRPTWLR